MNAITFFVPFEPKLEITLESLKSFAIEMLSKFFNPNRFSLPEQPSVADRDRTEQAF